MIETRNQLIDLLKELNLFHLPCAEIGVAQEGFSLVLLKAGCVKQYLVDNWAHIPDVTGEGNSPQEWHDKNYKQVLKTFEPFGDRAVILKGLSTKMAEHVPDNSLGLVWLDGAHYYKGVLNDLRAWYPKLVAGGIMAGHDYLNKDYGVEQAVKEFTNERVHTIPEEDIKNAGFWFIKK